MQMLQTDAGTCHISLKETKLVIALQMLTNVAVLASPGDPKLKIVIAVINTLVQFSLDCSDELNYINKKLGWSH